MATRKISAYDTLKWHYLCLVCARSVTYSAVCNRLLQDLPQAFTGAKPQRGMDIYRVPQSHQHILSTGGRSSSLLDKESAPLKPAAYPATPLSSTESNQKPLHRGQNPDVELWGIPVTSRGLQYHWASKLNHSGHSRSVRVLFSNHFQRNWNQGKSSWW